MTAWIKRVRAGYPDDHVTDRGPTLFTTTEVKLPFNEDTIAGAYAAKMSDDHPTWTVTAVSFSAGPSPEWG